MREKRMLRKIASLALCLTLAAHGFGWLSPAYAAGAGQTAYTFGDPNGPFRDLAKEHEEEVKAREKARKKAAKKQAIVSCKMNMDSLGRLPRLISLLLRFIMSGPGLQVRR